MSKLRPAMRAAVRRTLQHHDVTKTGDAVLEADLIEAVLGVLSGDMAKTLAKEIEAEIVREKWLQHVDALVDEYGAECRTEAYHGGHHCRRSPQVIREELRVVLAGVPFANDFDAASDARLKQLMAQTPMPNSLSFYATLKQLANEVAQQTTAKHLADPGIHVKLTNMARIKDGKLEMTPEFADWKILENVELYALPDHGKAPDNLFVPRKPWGTPEKVCQPCRATGAVHCANPGECGGPWTEKAE